ncbi:MAG: hypothetical protein MUF69_14315 [Desulfobacterota bacterium]|nr:hypothetical protein [Thermodesulfobacteriota bacterium]
MKPAMSVVAVLVGMVIFGWHGPAAARDPECTVITKIEGRQVTLTPDNKKLSPFLIETEDLEGLKVGDRVWVQEGKIVRCALPGRTPSPGRKP